MAVVLVPDFAASWSRRVARQVTVIGLQAVHPDDDLVPFLLRQRQNTLLQFGKTHLVLSILPIRGDFKPVLWTCELDRT
jgi:hypothetical protein